MPFRGIVIGSLISIPIWALIITFLLCGIAPKRAHAQTLEPAVVTDSAGGGLTEARYGGPTVIIIIPSPRPLLGYPPGTRYQRHYWSGLPSPYAGVPRYYAPPRRHSFTLPAPPVYGSSRQRRPRCFSQWNGRQNYWDCR